MVWIEMLVFVALVAAGPAVATQQWRYGQEHGFGVPRRVLAVLLALTGTWLIGLMAFTTVF